MAVKVDISYVAGDLRYIILNSAEVKSSSVNHRNNENNNNNKDVIIFADENNIQKIKQIIQHIFTQNHINDYIVAENTEVENEIAILKQGDMEQFGIYICTHCGMSFESEIQRTVHQRIHYFT
jgi:transcription elongation factor Elf1